MNCHKIETKTQAGKVRSAPAVLRMKSTFCVVHLKVRHLYQYKTHFTLEVLKVESYGQYFWLLMIFWFYRKRPWTKTTVSSLGFAICQISPTLIRFVARLWNDTFTKFENQRFLVIIRFCLTQLNSAQTLKNLVNLKIFYSFPKKCIISVSKILSANSPVDCKSHVPLISSILELTYANGSSLGWVHFLLLQSFAAILEKG